MIGKRDTSMMSPSVIGSIVLGIFWIVDVLFNAGGFKLIGQYKILFLI